MTQRKQEPQEVKDARILKEQTQRGRVIPAEKYNQALNIIRQWESSQEALSGASSPNAKAEVTLTLSLQAAVTLEPSNLLSQLGDLLAELAILPITVTQFNLSMHKSSKPEVDGDNGPLAPNDLVYANNHIQCDLTNCKFKHAHTRQAHLEAGYPNDLVCASCRVKLGNKHFHTCRHQTWNGDEIVDEWQCRKQNG